MSLRPRVLLPTVVAILAGWPGTAAAAPVEIVDEVVSFPVSNANTSRVACATDGADYIVRGHLVGPRSAVEGAKPATVTVYLHDFGIGEFFWHFTAVPGYDYARSMAASGHVSLTLDELGYDASDRPNGNLSCVGGQADIAHQVVTRLRSGDYGVEGMSPAFGKVVLAGHSTGALIAQVEAYSFQDVDGLAVLGFSDNGASQTAMQEFAATGAVCARGGELSEGDRGPPAYAYFGQTEGDFTRGFFNSENADPAVVSSAVALRNRGPCGDIGSVAPAIAADQASLSEVRVPVLLVYGEKDAVFPPEGASQQQTMFSGSEDVTTRVIPNSGHAFTLERSRGEFTTIVRDWLERHAFGGVPPVPRPPSPPSPGPRSPSVQLRLRPASPRVGRRRLVRLRVTCRIRPPRPCRGRIVARPRVAATRGFRLRRPGARPVSLRLSGRAYRRLLRRGRLRFAVTASAGGRGAPMKATTVRITVRPAGRRVHRRQQSRIRTVR